MRPALLPSRPPTATLNGLVADLGGHRCPRATRISVGAVPIPICWRPGRGHWLLARRNISTGELAYYVCYGPRTTG